MAKEQRGIQSIDVGGRLLQALARSSGAMMLKDIALAADMPPAKAHAYLVSFCKLGLMEQDAETGRYDLGALALQLGLASLNRLDAVKIATHEMSELAERTGQSVAIAVWGNYGPTIVRFQQSVRPVHINMRTGTVMSLVATATGHVFAAHLPKAQVDAALHATYSDAKQRSAAKKALNDLEPTLASVRKRGLARAEGYPLPGINAFSAPVFDHTATVTLALTILGASAEFDSSWEGELATACLQSAARISARLGSVPVNG
jgi:DNA-binding IclR family transcriptional regulator